jgi:hypothetical protein
VGDLVVLNRFSGLVACGEVRKNVIDLNRPKKPVIADMNLDGDF